MILYHAAWDAVFIAGMEWEWYHGTGAFIWQQSICWTFIILSGFCLPLGRHPVRRGIEVFGAGLLVTAVTVIFMPENRVVFGVLTLLGSCMILTGLLNRLLRKVPSGVGLLGSILLFWLTRWVSDGMIGIKGIFFLPLPQLLYKGLGMTFLGFTEPGFMSTDYFPMLPWYFLFLAGYFVCRICQRMGFRGRWWTWNIQPFGWMGRHSLVIYLLHQPVLYLLTVAAEWIF